MHSHRRIRIWTRMDIKTSRRIEIAHSFVPSFFSLFSASFFQRSRNPSILADSRPSSKLSRYSKTTAEIKAGLASIDQSINQSIDPSAFISHSTKKEQSIATVDTWLRQRLSLFSSISLCLSPVRLYLSWVYLQSVFNLYGNCISLISLPVHLYTAPRTHEKERKKASLSSLLSQPVSRSSFFCSFLLFFLWS